MAKKETRQIEKIEIVADETDAPNISENIRQIELKEDVSRAFFRKFSLIMVTLACAVFNIYLFISGAHELIMRWMFAMQIIMSIIALFMYLFISIVAPKEDSSVVVYGRFVHIFFIASSFAVFIYYMSRFVGAIEQV